MSIKRTKNLCLVAISIAILISVFTGCSDMGSNNYEETSQFDSVDVTEAPETILSPDHTADITEEAPATQTGTETAVVADTKEAETAKSPETTKTPETTKKPETTRIPETTRTPETTKIPETTKAPETTSIPETTKTPETTDAPDTQPTRDPYPWEEKGAKQPSEYSWTEFNALSSEHQIAFQNAFKNIEAFNTWMDNAQWADFNKSMPWNNGGKKPSEYTWEEFEALSPTEQMAFQNTFGSFDQFDQWMQRAQSATAKNPWDVPGAKQPSEYTWAEFEALPPAEQMAFQNSFDSFDKFDQWMQRAQSATVKNPWDVPGAKQPSEYTWAEFEALSPAEQMAFQDSFGSFDKFDQWLQRAQSATVKNPWDVPGAKQPSEYTWAEFEALSPAEQMAFQDSFGSFDKFDAWLQNAQTTAVKKPWDEPGSKQPSEYTWEEFNQLSGELQIAFQNSFSSFEEFDKWLMANMPG